MLESSPQQVQGEVLTYDIIRDNSIPTYILRVSEYYVWYMSIRQLWYLRYTTLPRFVRIIIYKGAKYKHVM